MTSRPPTSLPFAILLTLFIAVEADAQYTNPLTANHAGFWLEWITRADSTIADVALADADDDGDPDLFVVDGSSLELWRNDGRGNFAPDPAPLYPDPLGRILVGDADGDGGVDVIGAPLRGGLVFLRGSRFGGFGSPQVLSSGTAYSLLTPIDVDGDGAMEIACGGGWGAGLEIVPGPRSRIPSSAWFPGLTVDALAVADPNHDDRSDLVVNTTSETYDQKLVVLLNVRRGLAQAPVNQPPAGQIARILPLDFDGDGFEDLLVSYAWGEFALDVLLGNGSGADWGIRHIQQYDPLGNPAILRQPNQSPKLLIGWRSSIGTFLGVFDWQADPELTNPTVLSYTHVMEARRDPPDRILCGDLDGDGRQDVVLVNFDGEYSSLGGMIGVMSDRGGSPGGLRMVSVDIPARRIAAARINPSRPPQFLLSAPDGFYSTSVQEDGSLAPCQRIGAGQVVQVVDLNHDAKDDLIVELPDGATEVRFMRPNGPGPVAARLDGVVMTSGDLDDDRRPELLLHRRDDTLCVVWMGDGHLGRISSTDIFLGGDFDSYTLVTIGDPDGDGRQELIEARLHRPGHEWNPTLDTIATYRWKGTGLQVVERSLIWNVIPDPYTRPRDLQAANMDGARGDEIVVLMGQDRATLRILKPTFRGFHWLIGDCRIGGEGPYGLCLADFDGDGDVDAACASNFEGYLGCVRVGWNDGSGKLNVDWSRRIGFSRTLGMAAQDFDGDGIVDLAILTPSYRYDEGLNWIAFLYGRRDGTSSSVSGIQFPRNSPTVPRRLAIQAIAPNPARGAFAIHWAGLTNEPASLELHDVTGRRVREFVIESGQDRKARVTDLEDLPAGLYWVRLRQGKQTVTKRVALIR